MNNWPLATINSSKRDLFCVVLEDEGTEWMDIGKLNGNIDYEVASFDA